jgi:phosphate transport system permease protein
MRKKQKYKDIILNIITGLFSSVGILILTALLIFIFRNGWKRLSINLLISDYHEQVYNTKIVDNFIFHEYQEPELNSGYFSKKWGIALEDIIDKDGKEEVAIIYVDPHSPLTNMLDANSGEYVRIEKGHLITRVFLENESGKLIIGLAKDGAKKLRDSFDEGEIITDLMTKTPSGGIRGSIITTLYLIVLTLIIALPLGIAGAVYLHEYANNNKFNNSLRIMIDMTSGIPSIIFGLVGAVIFIPFMNSLIGSNGGSIASGALTLAIILLPVIIKTTEDALRVIPNSYRHASLALGASKTQTTFKVVLPNALPGILTATILSIGRIIGESAALIYAIGTVIKDSISINDKSTSLAVHIWSVMSGETPNFELASSISILILLIVLVLNVIVKFLGKKLNRFEVS